MYCIDPKNMTIADATAEVTNYVYDSKYTDSLAT